MLEWTLFKNKNRFVVSSGFHRIKNISKEKNVINCIQFQAFHTFTRKKSHKLFSYHGSQLHYTVFTS